jgi:hypothetical protein
MVVWEVSSYILSFLVSQLKRLVIFAVSLIGRGLGAAFAAHPGSATKAKKHKRALTLRGGNRAFTAYRICFK